MDRILRGVLRCSLAGLTNFLMASRLYASAPSETSAQTGRLASLQAIFGASLRGLFCLLGMCLPKTSILRQRSRASRRPLWYPHASDNSRDECILRAEGCRRGNGGVYSENCAKA